MCRNDSDCDDGSIYTKDICQKPGSVNSSCTHGSITCVSDLDCGAEMFSGAPFCSNNSVFRGFLSYTCNNPGQVTSYCTNSIENNFLDNCTYACANGNCVRCNDNIDCDDGNIYTEDICYFSGTSESYCSNEHIECFTDSECGDNSFVGLPFCSNGNIAQNYRTFSCINKGEPGSYCSNSLEARNTGNCSFGCSNAICLPGIHDVALIDFTNSIGGIRIKNATNDTVNSLECNKDYKFEITAENLGNFYENVTFLGNIGGLTLNHLPENNFAPSDSSLKTKTINNLSLAAGFYNISIQAIIPIDDNPENNFAKRQIQVTCSRCTQNSDCGIDYESDPFCSENNSIVTTIEFICHNPGQQNSFCTNSTDTDTEECEYGCVNGECRNCTSISSLKPFDIELVLDKSGSMTQSIDGTTKIKALKSSTINFINLTLDTNNKIGIVAFDHLVYDVLGLSSDKSSLFASVNSLAAAGPTNYNESIRRGVDNLVNNGRINSSKVIVFVSDGNPTIPTSSCGISCPSFNCAGVCSGGSTDAQDIQSAIEAANYAASKNIKIYTIGFGKSSNMNQTLLMQIASITGGKYSFANSTQALNNIYTDLGRNMTDIICEGEFIPTLEKFASLSGVQQIENNIPETNLPGLE